ncbi:hypothetical protein M406DRAFT_68171 [Cryphonectria parasitica EP155]|uniref:Uncharacterized protein n=1 Tax=Cryphonectria parasitica (strain ATCC 38755 / EP155) TaxID=660469 RepID=A0A9P5CNS0_CRYP1|nr:uncharacterized protein M406DRAFT_68171 [Cryphonectria parasitica EP155]KAF3765754.1 hypothetical protein M406DRAFT_68171 [Cryphonectria parasitica EP155]
MIVDVLEADSPKTLSTLALVSPTFYDLARHAQHRQITLNLRVWDRDVQGEKQARARMEYLDKFGFLPDVRRLTISGAGATPALMAELGRFIIKLSGLRDLAWQYQDAIPEPVLAFLQDRPTIRLHVVSIPGRVVHENGTVAPVPLPSPPDPHARNADRSKAYVLEQLVNSRSLYSLDVRCEYVDAAQCFNTMLPLRRVLQSCPNLRKLTLKVGLPKPGCFTFSPLKEYTGLGFTEAERPVVALEELEVAAYPFGRPAQEGICFYGSPWPHWQPSSLCHSDGYPLAVREEVSWGSIFDWSRLRRLHTADSDLGLQLLPWLTALREVDLGLGMARSADIEQQDLRMFYDDITSPLEAITVRRLVSIGLDNLLRHGPSLRRLKIHQIPTQKPVEWEQSVSAEDLLAISEGCPHIEELAVDVCPEGEWPQHIYRALASFRQLQHLEFFQDFEEEEEEENKEKLIITGRLSFAASRICHYLRDQAFPRKAPFKTLTVHYGHKPVMPGGLYDIRPYKDRSHVFQWTLSERQDEAEQGVYHMTPDGMLCQETNPKFSS